jgi:hypothetical protein
MSYTYASFQSALALNMAIPNANVASPNFVAILPTIIDYAEQRCYRDLDLLNATLTITSALTALQRIQSLAPATNGLPILILENFNVVLSTGERVQLYPTSREFIDSIYGGPQSAAMPQYYGMVDDQDIVLGPWPDQAYACEFIGKFRPVPLYNATPPSGGNPGTQTTYLTSILPDLFLAAAMISAAGYQKNFGAQADDPKMAMAWETQYQSLLPTAKAEEMRKKQHGWMALTSQQAPPPTPPPPPPGG